MKDFLVKYLPDGVFMSLFKDDVKMELLNCISSSNASNGEATPIYKTVFLKDK